MRRKNPKSVERRTNSRRKAKVFEGTGTSREVGVNLSQGYNGDLTSRQAGSIGGQMVKNVKPVRKMSFLRADRNAVGHKTEIRYAVEMTV